EQLLGDIARHGTVLLTGRTADEARRRSLPHRTRPTRNSRPPRPSALPGPAEPRRGPKTQPPPGPPRPAHPARPPRHRTNFLFPAWPQLLHGVVMSQDIGDSFASGHR